jgi:hypothetical protein
MMTKKLITTNLKDLISPIQSTGNKKELFTLLKIKVLVDLVGLSLLSEDFKD